VRRDSKRRVPREEAAEVGPDTIEQVMREQVQATIKAIVEPVIMNQKRILIVLLWGLSVTLSLGVLPRAVQAAALTTARFRKEDNLPLSGRIAGEKVNGKVATVTRKAYIIALDGISAQEARPEPPLVFACAPRSRQTGRQ